MVNEVEEELFVPLRRVRRFVIARTEDFLGTNRMTGSLCRKFFNFGLISEERAPHTAKDEDDDDEEKDVVVVGLGGGS